MTYYVKMELYCDYAEQTSYFKIEESDFSSREALERHLDYEGHESARDFAEGYEYLLFGWDFNLEEAIAEGEMTEEDYEQEIEYYYASAGYAWDFVSEEEYMDNEEYWA